jgi:RNase P/RNase MRP subunit p29
LALIGLVAAVIGCDTGTSTGPADAGAGNTSTFAAPQFSDLQDTVTIGPLRLEIRLFREALVAREVEVEDEADRDEEIEGHVVAIETDAFVLEPGSIRVQFDGTTRFRFDDDSDEVNAEAFLARVQQRLDGGERPMIDAERRAGVEPQDPSDATFVARRIDLEDDDDDDDDGRGTKLEMFVDGDNLIPNDAPPPHGWIRVLGVDIEIRLDGTTRLEIDDDDRDDDGEIEFEARVQSVDLDASTVTLSTSRVVRIVAATRFDHDDDDDGEHLRTLEQVAEAVGFALRVKAEGEGDAAADDPAIVVADEIEFEIEDERERDFEGRVASVDVDGETVTLTGGQVIRLASFTEWESDDGHLKTLEAVAEAVAGGDRVEVDGDGIPLDDGGLLAIEIEFEREDD